MITCCKDCQQRQVNCHANCNTYKSEREQETELKRKNRLTYELARYLVSRTE